MTARKAPAPLAVIPFTGDIEALPLPTNGPYFVMMKTGPYIHKFFEFGRVLLPVKEISSLPELTVDGKPTIAMLWNSLGEKPFPAELIGKAWHFFRQVWNAKHSEAMVDITLHPEKGYRLFVPPQSANTGGVEAKRNLTHYDPRSRHIGTIHSHCNFGAFHSGTDTHDAGEHDGLHITIGNVDKNPPSIALMISMGKIRWDYSLEEVTGVKEIPYIESPAWWLNQMKGSLNAPKVKETQTTHGWEKWAKPANDSKGHGPSEDRRIIPFAGTIDKAVEEGKRGKGRHNDKRSLTLNKVYLSKDLYGRSIEEIFYTAKLTNAQQNRMEDALEYITEIDILLASMGLQLDYGVIEGALPNDEVIRRFFEQEGI